MRIEDQSFIQIIHFAARIAASWTLPTGTAALGGGGGLLQLSPLQSYALGMRISSHSSFISLLDVYWFLSWTGLFLRISACDSVEEIHFGTFLLNYKIRGFIDVPAYVILMPWRLLLPVSSTDAHLPSTGSSVREDNSVTELWVKVSAGKKKNYF